MPRIIFKEKPSNEKCSTTATVVTAKNHLLQIRQFATGGMRFFYQPDTWSEFLIVQQSDMPQAAQELLLAARKVGMVSSKKETVEWNF